MSISTREDLEEYFYQLLNPTKQYRQENNGRLSLGSSAAHYSKDQAEVEGFLRTLWAIGPMAGNGNYDLKDFQFFIDSIIHSTTENDPAYWGTVKDFDQLIVEMASLAVTLIETKNIFWNTLNMEEQNSLYNWLNQINHVGVHPNNWRFFRILVNVAFLKLGQPYDREKLKEDLALIDSMYIKDGWYMDGNNRQQDYYIPWAFHYYGLLYAHFMKEEDPENSHKFIERAKIFAKTFAYWFDDDGEGVPFGRSLTYRFAQGAFWSVCIYTGVKVLPMAEMKYLILQHFSYWQQLPIQKNDGILSIGYGYEDFYMAERYNSPGSPYWSFKSFIILGVKKDDLFWAIEPVKPQRLEKCCIPAAKMILTNENGYNVQLYPVNQWTAQIHAAEKYSKFVYSSLFGFSVTKGALGLGEGAFDNCLAIAEKGTKHYFSKEEVASYEVTSDFTKQSWSPFAGTLINSTVVPLGPWHIRIHQIQTQRDIEVADGGFSNKTFNGHANDYVISEVDNGKSYTSEIGTTASVNIHGYKDITTIFPETNTNLLFPNSLYFVTEQVLGKGDHLLISAHYGSKLIMTSIPEVLAEKNQVTINYEGKKIVITL